MILEDEFVSVDSDISYERICGTLLLLLEINFHDLGFLIT